jgi:hypothetical protein
MSLDTKNIAWKPWAVGAHGSLADVLGMAESWLGDFGLGLLPDSTSTPDAYASLDDLGEHFAFRFDSGAKSIVVFVTIDHDPPSRCVRIEVQRV